MASTEFVHEHWSSRRAFLLAAIGGAVGLGNIWRFPYITGVNGGGAFVLVYGACIALIGIPLLMAEIAVGRRGGQSALSTMRKLNETQGSSRFWEAIGWQAMAVATLGLMYYGVVAGWTLDYTVSALAGAFEDIADKDDSNAVFGALIGNAPRMMLTHGLFMVITVAIVARGVQKGIEKAAKYLMPTLAALLVVLVVYAALTADFPGGLRFLFRPDFYKLTPSVALTAVGQAFFSLGVTVGMFITYGAYVPKNVSIPKMVTVIAVADTVVALVVGLVIFPLVLSYGLEPGEGPQLIFVTLPIAFGLMPLGRIFGALFFFLTAIAALTSSLGMLEPAVSWLEEHRGFQRKRVAIAAGTFIWLFGLLALFSYNHLADFRPVADKNIFDIMDFVTANLLIPIGGLLLALYSGWVFPRDALREELGLPESFWFDALRFVLKFVAPAAILSIFVTAF